MKKTINAILLFMISAVVLVSCGDDKNPPTAGFSLSDDSPVKWDEVAIINQSIEAGDISYTITGGGYEIASDNSEIIFFDNATYTVTQMVSNADGTDSESITVNVSNPDNNYTIGGDKFEFLDEPVWKLGNPEHGTKDMLEFQAKVSGQDFPDYIRIAPSISTQGFEGTYSYDDGSGELGTYFVRVIKNYDPSEFSSDWTMDFKGSDGGSDMTISVVYSTDNPTENIYDITIESYSLSTGQFDWATFTFIPEQVRSFTFYYRGLIYPEPVG